MSTIRQLWEWARASVIRLVSLLGLLVFLCLCLPCGALYVMLPKDEAGTETATRGDVDLLDLVATATATQGPAVAIATNTVVFVAPTATSPPVVPTTAAPTMVQASPTSIAAEMAATETPAPAWAGTATINAQVVNLRAGPSTDHGIVRQASEGEQLPVYGRLADGSWLQIDEGGGLWVYAELANLDVGLEVVPVVEGPAAAPVSQPTVAVVATDTPVVVVATLPAATGRGCLRAQEPGCDIKGNISSRDEEKIYHVPGCNSYNQTKIDPSKGECWFCSEADAIAAGWRKAENCP